uniref:Uncharacterized protein n=1 Tax=Anguilla anguilla TaxID=7936 RepID=A0A0E9V1B1_ANGAN
MHCKFKLQMRHVLVLAKQMRSLCKTINQMTNNTKLLALATDFPHSVLRLNS